MNMLKSVICGVSLTIVAASSTVAAKNYYKWTDANGVTHYSAQKPHNTEVETVAIRGGRTTTSASESENAPTQTQPTSSSQPAESSESSNETVEHVKDPVRCDAAKKIIDTISSAPRVQTKDENGELRFLSDQEKSDRLEEAKQAIKESC